MRGRQWLVVMVGVGLLSVAADTSAQTVEARDTIGLSLEEALDRSMERSEEVRIAAAQVDRAGAEVGVARSNLLPQVNTQLGYTRTLRSVFQGGGFEIPDSMRFEPDSTASIAQRLRYLEQNVPNAAFQSLGSLFSGLPFGQEHTWNAAATLQQALFAPAAVSGVQLANRAEEAARASYEEAVSDVTLDVAEAYLGAALAEQTAEIVEASVELAAAHLAQVRLQFDAGVASELDVLRAEVELENLRPQLAQANNGRDLAIANLKRLVNIPAQVEVRLTTPLAEPGALTSRAPADLPTLTEADAVLERRASVRAARANVAMMEEQADIARSSFLPSVYLQGNMARQAFPSGFLPGSNDWRDDWNVGFAVSWPLFQGMRRKAEVDAANAQVRQAELQAAQLEEGVRLEYDSALRELERARLQMEAAGTTVAQAQRVYELTELRYREGLATQLDVSDARLALQQAQLNEATAYHDYHLALANALRALGRPATELVRD